MNLQPIPGWPDYYATDRGDIVSKKFGRTKTLKPYAWPADSHQYVRLSKPGVNEGGVKKWVHRLVLSAFHRPPKKGELCRHLDGSKQNNAPRNLKWGRDAANAHDRLEHSGSAKLTATDVRSIRARAELGFSTVQEMADEFDVVTSTIRNILSRKTWAKLTDTDEEGEA